MKIIVPTAIISFFLDNFFSVNNFSINDHHLFVPLFTLISLIIIYPFCNNNDKKFYQISLILGLCYDIIYTNTFLLNTFVFLLMALLINFINVWLSNNIINNILMTIIVICFYRTVTYIILVIIGYLNFDVKELGMGILNSLIINIIYVVTTYIITDYISRHKKISKIN